MVSGYGVTSGKGRCYSFWQSFVNCMQNGDDTVRAQGCGAFREDYKECLHHVKTHARASRVEAARKEAESEGALPKLANELLTKDFKNGVPEQ